VLLQLVDPPTQKGFQQAPLVIKCWKFARRKKAKKTNENKYIFLNFKAIFGMEIYLCSLFLAFSRLRFFFPFYFDCAKTETPFRLLRMHEERDLFQNIYNLKEPN
jgi:hypothetical protein